MKYTPGPWKIWNEGKDLNPSCIVGYEKGFICQTLHGNDLANANLIAAAPDLLRGTKLALSFAKLQLERGIPRRPGDMIEELEEIIARVEGSAATRA